MSTWAALRRELRETEISDVEFKALRLSLTKGFKRLAPNVLLEVPSVTRAGHPYMLRIPTGADAKPIKIEVDLNPDLSSPAFDACTDFRNRSEEEAAKSGAEPDCATCADTHWLCDECGEPIPTCIHEGTLSQTGCPDCTDHPDHPVNQHREAA